MLTKAFILAVVLCAQVYGCYAQSFTITKVERSSDNVLLYYDLVDTIRNRTYTVNLYSSADNFTTPLQKTQGDVGIEIKPGGNRKITWNAKEEMGSSFNGEIALEVRGKIYIPFVKLDSFDDYKKFKRNKAYNITWTGGRGNSVLNFDLYRGEKKIASYPNIANVGHYNLKFEKIKAGKNYRLKISDSKNKDDVVYSAPFKIKPKVPLLLKLLPMAGAGYLVTTLVGGSTGSNDIVDPVEPQ